MSSSLTFSRVTRLASRPLNSEARCHQRRPAAVRLRVVPISRSISTTGSEWRPACSMATRISAPGSMPSCSPSRCW